ncbi:MAG: hypothetical protein NVS4B6_07180 [Mycobacterium sp.]
MPSFRRRASVVNADGVGRPRETDRSATAAEALALAEEAEAEAAEADAVAAAVRARARAIRLRRQAQTAATEETAEATPTATDIEDTDEARVDETGTEAGTAAVAGGEDEPQESAEPTPARRRLRSRLRFSRGPVLKALAATVGIACTVALITLSVLMVISHRHQAAEAARRAEFTAAGRQSVVTLMSLDFNKAKDDVQRIIDNSTGQFHDDFKNQADDFIKVTQESKVITEVTVNATAVEQMTNDSATVLVSATSHVSNSAGAKQEPRSWRLSVILQRDGGQIKMARVEFVP